MTKWLLFFALIKCNYSMALWEVLHVVVKLTDNEHNHTIVMYNNPNNICVINTYYSCINLARLHTWIMFYLESGSQKHESQILLNYKFYFTQITHKKMKLLSNN